MRVNNLQKSYDKLLFKDLSFEINSGLVLIQGKSGCGKTTLLKILMGLVTQDKGEILYEEKDKFSYAGQEDSLNFELSFRENYEYLFSHELDSEAKELLARFNFEYAIDNRLSTLSGGERMLASLLIAFLKKADFYVFDEVLAPLDNAVREKATTYIESFSQNHLVFLTNHVPLQREINYALMIEFTDSICRVINGEKVNTDPEIAYEKRLIKKPDIELKTFLRSRKFASFLSLFFTLLVFISFAFSISLTDFSSRSENRIKALEAENREDFSISYREYNSDDGFPIDILTSSTEMLKYREEVIINNGSNPNYYKASNNEYLLAKDFSFSENGIKETIEFEILDSQRALNLIPDTPYFDGALEKMCFYFIPDEVFNKFITSNLSSISIGTTVFPNRIIRYDSDRDRYIFSMPLNTDDIESNFKIIDSDELFVSSSFWTDNGKANIYLGDTNTSISLPTRHIDGDDILISLTLYKLLMTAFDNYSEFKIYYTFVSKSDAIKLYQKYENISIFEIPIDYSHGNNLAKLLYIITICLFALTVIYTALSKRGNKEYFRSYNSFLSLNRLSKEKRKNALLASLFFTFIPYLISIIFYLIFTLYGANWLLYLYVNLFDTKLVNYLAYTPYYLFSLILFLFNIGINYLFFLPYKKAEN